MSEAGKRRARQVAAVIALGLLALASWRGPSFLHLVRVGQRLDEARGAPTLVERRAAYAWLLEHAPEHLIGDLLSGGRERLTTVTGDYVRAGPAGAPPAPIRVCPMVDDLVASGELNGRLLREWSRVCEADAEVALETAELVATLLRPQRHDVRACFVLTLCGDGRPGLRRMAYEWLVLHEEFPRDHDWRAPTLHELSRPSFLGPSPLAGAAREREDGARRWLKAADEQRPVRR